MSLHFKISKYLLPYRILQFKYKWEALQYSDPDTVCRYQLEKIRAILEHCRNHVPYYRDLFKQNDIYPGDIRTLEDLRMIPELSKDILRREQERLVSEKGWRFLQERLLTSGTTGEKISIWVDPVARAQEFVRYWLFFQRGGYRIGKPFAEFSSDFFMDREDPLQVLFQKNPVTGQLLLNTSYISRENAGRYLELMRDNRVLFIKSRPSSLYIFSRHVQDMGAEDIGLKCIFTIGEPLLEEQRKCIETTFGCRILNFYGHMERVVAMSECIHGRMHVDEGYGLVELQDVGGQMSGEWGRKFRLLGTSMHNRLMPFIRYDTGDLVEVDDSCGPCPCGNRSRVIKRISGRAEDLILGEDGAVYPALFLVFNMIDGIQMGQIIQDELLSFRVNIYPDADRFTVARKEELLFHLRKYLGSGAAIDVRLVDVEGFDYGTSGKFRSVISSVTRR